MDIPTHRSSADLRDRLNHFNNNIRVPEIALPVISRIRISSSSSAASAKS
jgi:hypothetical protein